MTEKDTIKELFEVGAHYASSRARRHPSAKPYIFGAKEKTELFDLTKTTEALERAVAFVRAIAEAGKPLLFVATKAQAKTIVREAAERTGQPYVTERWIGGTLSNKSQINKRVEKLKDLRGKQETGGLEKYTKKERLMIERDVARLENNFGGLVGLSGTPGAVFLVDPHYETVAFREARTVGVPTVALAGSDCDVSLIDYPIPANDSNVKSIAYVVQALADAYAEGATRTAAPTKDTAEKTEA